MNAKIDIKFDDSMFLGNEEKLENPGICSSVSNSIITIIPEICGRVEGCLESTTRNLTNDTDRSEYD